MSEWQNDCENVTAVETAKSLAKSLRGIKGRIQDDKA